MADIKEQSKLEQLEAKLAPPSGTHFSTIMNGVGNGMMLGMVPPLGYSLYMKATKKALSAVAEARLGTIGAIMTAVGAIGGLIYGRREAQGIEEYRADMTDEISKLRADVDANSKLVYGWQAQIEAQRQKTAEKPTPATDSVSR